MRQQLKHLSYLVVRALSVLANVVTTILVAKAQDQHAVTGYFAILALSAMCATLFEWGIVGYLHSLHVQGGSGLRRRLAFQGKLLMVLFPIATVLGSVSLASRPDHWLCGVTASIHGLALISISSGHIGLIVIGRNALSVSLMAARSILVLMGAWIVIQHNRNVMYILAFDVVSLALAAAWIWAAVIRGSSAIRAKEGPGEQRPPTDAVGVFDGGMRVSIAMVNSAAWSVPVILGAQLLPLSQATSQAAIYRLFALRAFCYDVASATSLSLLTASWPKRDWQMWGRGMRQWILWDALLVACMSGAVIFATAITPARVGVSSARAGLITAVILALGCIGNALVGPRGLSLSITGRSSLLLLGAVAGSMTAAMIAFMSSAIGLPIALAIYTASAVVFMQLFQGMLAGPGMRAAKAASS